MSGVERSEKITSKKKSFKEMSWRKKIKVIRYWIVTHPLEIMFGILVLVAIILFVNPFPQLDLIIDKLPFGFGGFANNVGQWIAYEGGATLSGGVFIAVALAIVGIRMRQYTLSKKHLWSNICPNCASNFTLKRIRRSKQERLINLFQIPVRRYRCTSCQWTGRRIDEDQI
jgi:hypothetical protein